MYNKIIARKLIEAISTDNIHYYSGNLEDSFGAKISDSRLEGFVYYLSDIERLNFRPDDVIAVEKLYTDEWHDDSAWNYSEMKDPTLYSLEEYIGDDNIAKELWDIYKNQSEVNKKIVADTNINNKLKDKRND